MTISSNPRKVPKVLFINAQNEAKAGFARANAHKQAERWQKEHKEAINSSNTFIELRGLPLKKYRMF